MARWIVFEYDEYYPSGGMRDCKRKTNLFSTVMDEVERVVANNSKYGHMSILDNRTENHVDFKMDDSLVDIVDKIHLVSDMEYHDVADTITIIYREPNSEKGGLI